MGIVYVYGTCDLCEADLDTKTVALLKDYRVVCGQCGTHNPNVFLWLVTEPYSISDEIPEDEDEEIVEEITETIEEIEVTEETEEAPEE